MDAVVSGNVVPSEGVSSLWLSEMGLRLSTVGRVGYGSGIGIPGKLSDGCALQSGSVVLRPAPASLSLVFLHLLRVSFSLLPASVALPLASADFFLARTFPNCFKRNL